MSRVVDHSVGICRKDHVMPNGGYPMQLLTPIGETDLAVHVRATQVSVWQQVKGRDDADTRPTYMPVADLTPEQVCALVYHLLYWSGADSHDLLATLRSGQLPIGPQFRSRGCLYEY